MCQFTFYKDEEKGTYYPQLYCHITDKECLYRKKCLTEGKYILIDGESWKDCYIMNDYLLTKNLPEGAYKVLTYNTRKNGKIELYVRLNEDTTIKVESPKNEPLEYVYLDKVDGKYIAYSEPIEKKSEPEKVEVPIVKENKSKKTKTTYNGKKKN